MTVILVDNDEAMLSIIHEKLLSLPETNSCVCFQSPYDALSHAKTTQVDIAFLDIEMPGIDGLSLCTELRKINPSTSVIFITSHAAHAAEAFGVKADGYILKPPSGGAIAEAVRHVMNGVPPKAKKRFFVRTFGDFDLFVDGRLVHFSNSKAKEFLAYLVDRRGGSVTVDRAISVLWENRKNDAATASLFRTVIADLKRTLKGVGAECIFIDKRNQKSVNTAMFSCDFYDFLEGNPAAQSVFMGEYMLSYEWAESTLAALFERVRGGMPV